MLFAMLAKFIHLQSAFQKFFIFLGKIIYGFALRAFQFDHIVLAHRWGN
jgi:hypothetical protein